jgi:predicted amidohydrolase
MKTVRIAAAQTPEFREDTEAALDHVADVTARAKTEAASLLCFPEGFLQGYLTDETPARRNALDLTSPAFDIVLNRLPKTGPMIVMGLIEVEKGRLFNTAIVVDRGTVIGRYRKVHLLASEHIFGAGLRDAAREWPSSPGEHCSRWSDRSIRGERPAGCPMS